MRIVDPSDLLAEDLRAELLVALYKHGSEILSEQPRDAVSDRRRWRLHGPGGWVEFAAAGRDALELVACSDDGEEYLAAQAAAFAPSAARKLVRGALDAWAGRQQGDLFTT